MPHCYKDVEIRRYKGKFEIHEVGTFTYHDCAYERMKVTVNHVLSHVKYTITGILDEALKENTSGASNDLWQENYRKEHKSA